MVLWTFTKMLTVGPWALTSYSPKIPFCDIWFFYIFSSNITKRKISTKSVVFQLKNRQNMSNVFLFSHHEPARIFFPPTFKKNPIGIGWSKIKRLVIVKYKQYCCLVVCSCYLTVNTSHSSVTSLDKFWLLSHRVPKVPPNGTKRIECPNKVVTLIRPNEISTQRILLERLRWKILITFPRNQKIWLIMSLKFRRVLCKFLLEPVT